MSIDTEVSTLDELLEKEGVGIVVGDDLSQLFSPDMACQEGYSSELYFLAPAVINQQKQWCLFYKNSMGILEYIDLSDVIDLPGALNEIPLNPAKIKKLIADYYRRNQEYLIANEMGRVQEEASITTGNALKAGTSLTALPPTLEAEIDEAGGLFLTILASLMWVWMLYKIKPDKNNSYMESFIARHIQHNYYDQGTGQRFSEFRAKLNPWYRRFKTAAVLGYTVGQTIANFIPFLHMLPKPVSSMAQALFGGVTGLIFGLFGSFFLPGDSVDAPVKLHINSREDKTSPHHIDKKTYVLTCLGSLEEPVWILEFKDKSGNFNNIPLKNIKGLREILSVYKNPNNMPDSGKSAISSLIHAYENRQSKLYKLGGDGWTKYAKVGLVMGSSVGAGIGALIGTFVLPGVGSGVGAAIGAGIGGIVGFIGFAAGVPLINKIFPDDPTVRKLGPLGDTLGRYRTNYVRAGMALGGSLCMLIGGIIGSVVPGIGSLVGALVGGAIGSLLGGIGLMAAGPYISAYLGEDRTQSTFDYDTRTGMMFGNQYGLGLFASAILGLNPVIAGHKDAHGNSVDVKDMVCSAGGLVAGVLALGYSVYYGYKHRNQPKNDYEKEKVILPWSQRAATFIITGFQAGALIGGVIGFCVGGPAGAALGAAIGGAVGGASSGVVGSIWGEKILQKVSGFAQKVKNFIGVKCEEKLEEKQVEITNQPQPLNSSAYSKINEKLKNLPNTGSINADPQPVPAVEKSQFGQRCLNFEFGCLGQAAVPVNDKKLTPTLLDAGDFYPSCLNLGASR